MNSNAFIALALAENGYCVVKVIDPSDLVELTGMFHDWYKGNGLDALPSPPHGIYKYHKVGHSAFAWAVRTYTPVREVFEDFYKTKDLIVSFDGCAYHSATETRQNRYWGHVDQGLLNKDFACIQGSVSMTTNSSAGFACVPGSHLEFGSHLERPTNLNKRWVKVAKYTLADMVNVPVQAGDMILWDSRLVHQNLYAPEERLVQFVSYLPRSVAKPADLVKRRKYFETQRTTTHWPTPVEVVGMQPQVYGDTSKLVDYDTVTLPDPGSVMINKRDSINKLV